MRLLIHPTPPLRIFGQELDMVISASEQGPPEVFVREGLTQPDRHFLLGVVQAVAMAVEESVREFTAFMEADSIALENAGSVKELPNGLIIVRTEDGFLGALAVPDHGTARRLTRKVVRWFTGAIRLDIP